MHTHTKSTNRWNRVRSSLAAVALVAAGSALVPSTAAHAQTAGAFCSTVQTLATNGDLWLSIVPSDSIPTVESKVNRIGGAFTKIRRVAPASVRQGVTNVVNDFANAKRTLLQLKKARGSLASALRDQFTALLEKAQGDIDLLSTDIVDLCGFGLTDDSSADSGDSGFDDGASTPPPTTATRTTARTIQGSGVYEIGTDIAPGPYTTRGRAGCRAGLGNSPVIPSSSVSEDGFMVSVTTSGATTFQVDPGYRYFYTDGCNNWVPGTRL